jgi:hypothetical protein
MFIIQTDSEGARHAVATGKILGRYVSRMNAKGFMETEFTLCIKTNMQEHRYKTLKVVAYGETASRIVNYCKQNKETLIALGNCAIDKAMTDLRGEKYYCMFASALIAPQMVFETFMWHKNTMQIDKILSENYEKNIRYDYTEEPKEEDHRI